LPRAVGKDIGVFEVKRGGSGEWTNVPNVELDPSASAHHDISSETLPGTYHVAVAGGCFVGEGVYMDSALEGGLNPVSCPQIYIINAGGLSIPNGNVFSIEAGANERELYQIEVLRSREPQ